MLKYFGTRKGAKVMPQTRDECGELNQVSQKNSRMRINSKIQRGQRSRIGNRKGHLVNPNTSRASESGALPQKWVEIEQKDITDVWVEVRGEVEDEVITLDTPSNGNSPETVMRVNLHEDREGVTIFDATSNANLATGLSSAMKVSETPTNSTQIQISDVKVSVESLTTVSEKLTEIVKKQEGRRIDDDRCFALSMVPAMRNMSVANKLKVRSKIQAILEKEFSNEPIFEEREIPNVKLSTDNEAFWRLNPIDSFFLG